MRKVLIIDDSLTARMDLHEAFMAAGWATTLCASLADARKAIGQDPFDAVVLDVLLPDGSGIDLLGELKAATATADIPVILLSAREDVARQVAQLPAGADEYAPKPYDRSHVVSQAQTLADRRVPSAAGASAPTIIVIDDSPTYLDMLSRHLKSDGFQVAQAQSGPQALDMLDACTADCVLLDMLMPDMSGQEVCRRIKNSPRWREIPVIMLTGREDEQAMTESFTAGADDFVPKSSDFSVLRARLRAQLRRRQVEQESLQVREELYRKGIEVVQAQAAAEMARQWQTTFNAMNDGVGLLSRDGSLRRVNCAMIDILGGPCEDGLPPQLQSHVAQLFEESRETCRRQAAEVVFNDRWYNVTVDPVEGPPGGEVSGLLILGDITDRKLAQEALQQTADDLVRSNRELEQFAYIASHDLQEPLRMVSGFLKLLRERAGRQLDAKAHEYIGYSVEGAVRMSQLISDLLAYSRLQRSGNQFEQTDPNKALELALDNLRQSIQDAGATVTHDQLPTITADPTQLMQLFQNLISNAIKFRRHDQPCEIHVDADTHDAQCVFAVHDNGIGIPPEQSERVFMIFQRLHARDKYPGTGIGLAICKKIVEVHGGRIWVESKPGEGCTFRFTLKCGV